MICGQYCNLKRSDLDIELLTVCVLDASILQREEIRSLCMVMVTDFDAKGIQFNIPDRAPK